MTLLETERGMMSGCMSELCAREQKARLSKAVVWLSRIEQKESVYRFAAPARRGPLVSVPWLS